MIENEERPSRLLCGSEGHNNEAGKPHCHSYSNTQPQPVKTRIETEGKIIGYLEGGCFRNYECPTKVFAEHAFEIQRGNFEPQLALTLNHWEVKNNGHHQLGLWGGGDDGR